MKNLLMMTLAFLSLSAFAIGTAKPKNSDMTQLDDLIRGEMSAVNAYDKVISDIKDSQEKARLESIRQNHQNAVDKLSKYVEGKPSLTADTESSGAWGKFVKGYTKAATLMGNKAAVKALTQGEEHGVSEYKEALKDKTISADLKQTIKTQFLPNQERHIHELKGYM